MRHRSTLLPTRAAAWLVGFALLLTGLQAAAQQDPPGRVGRLNFHQGAVSFSPAGEDNWYEVVPNRPLTTGDRLWTDRNARAELYVGSTAVRLDEQTSVTLTEVDDDTARITASQGNVQVRVRDDLAGQRFEVDTGNLAVVIGSPGDYRIESDPNQGTTRVAVAAGNVTLYGEGGETMPLGANQQITTSGRNLAAANGSPVRPAGEFDRWVAERDRAEDQSISARYVSRDVVGYQQLDAYGDWQSDPNYGNVWYPRDVDAEWAPYQNGQWVDVAPWGWTWIDAAPWGFAPAHYGRWARIGPRWGWVPGRQHARPVYSPAVVGFVGGGRNPNLIPGRHGVGWFPLAPGETWRPGYHASQRYIDEANRAAAVQRRAARGGYANALTPGAVTVVPTDVFGRGMISRRDVVRVPPERIGSVPVDMGAPIPLRGDHSRGAFGRPAAMLPPAALQARQFQQVQQMQQAQQQMQQAQRQQIEGQQRAAAQAVQAQQAQQFQQVQRQQQEVQQRAAAQVQQAQQLQQAQRQQQEAQQRAAAQAMQAQQAQQLQQAQRQQQEVQQRAAAQAMQAQQAQQLQQQAQRQQMEIQQRAAQAQAQQAQQMQQQQLQALRQQQEMQQRAAQAQAQQMQQLQQQQAARAQQQMQAQQQMLQAQQMQQQAMRQAQEVQQRMMQAQQQRAADARMPQRGGVPGQRDPNQQPDRP